MKRKNVEKKKGSKKKWFIVAAVVIAAVAAASGGGNGNNGSNPVSSVSSQLEETAAIPDYKNISNSEYARDGKKCITYRVSVSSDLSDDELTAVFNDVCNDDYYLHTVFYYSSDDKAAGGDAYDVAMLEETAPGSDPVITR